jgi:hypothetical protein
MSDRIQYFGEQRIGTGEGEALEDQLGSPEGMHLLGSAMIGLTPGGVRDFASLREALHRYAHRHMFPHELGIICEAHIHASAGHSRELIELDLKAAALWNEGPMRDASRHVGRVQLRKLKALKGQKLVGRYLDAIQQGDAFGSHAVVYGVVLALYSIPLRQGLSHYSQQTLDGFVTAGMRHLSLGQAEADELHRELCVGLPAAIEQTLGSNGQGIKLLA